MYVQRSHLILSPGKQHRQMHPIKLSTPELTLWL